MKQVCFYFDYISPFGWIAAERIGSLARAHAVTVDWRPFLLKVTVKDAMGLRPLLETPLKGPYLLHDARRQARFYGLELHDNASNVFSSVAPARATVWARQQVPELVEPLVLALYRRWMAEGRDISSPESVIDVAAGIGINATALAAGLEDPAIKETLRHDVEETIAAGVFGSPTLVIDDELFWGSDRVDQAFTWLERGGW